MLIGLVIVCHAMLDGCTGVTLTELPHEVTLGSSSRLYFENKEECKEAFQERVPNLQAIFLEALGPAAMMSPLQVSLYCITEEEAQRDYGVKPHRISL